MTTAVEATEIFREGARLNREDPLVSGSLICFPNYGQVVMTGDLHGHRRNFEKLKRFCALEHAAARHVVLHEIIHEEVESLDGDDRSHEVFLDAARWKCEFPDQIHFLLSNHELAQILRHEITKKGRVVTLDFEQSVERTYGDGSAELLAAMYDFIRSFAVAGRTANRVFLSHSLPAPHLLPMFDPSILSRALTADDLADRGSAHSMVWGRFHTEAALTTLRELLDVDFFVCGHQPQETGYEVLHERMVILASEHNHGVFLPLDLGTSVTLEKLTKHIRPFAGVA